MAGFEPAASASRTLNGRTLADYNGVLWQVGQEVRTVTDRPECRRARDRCGMDYARAWRFRLSRLFLRHRASSVVQSSQKRYFPGATERDSQP
jgi:hypothetical protein